MAYILTLQLASGMSGKGITTDANIDSTIIKESTSSFYTQSELNAILFEMWQQGGGKLIIEYIDNIENLPAPTINTIGKLYLVPSENQQELNIKEEWITITRQTTVIGAMEVYQENDPDWDQSNDAILLGFVNGVCGYYVVDYRELGSFIPLKLGDTINDNSISKHYTVITRNGGPAWSGALDGIVSEPTTLYNWELIGSTQVNLENYYTKSQIDTNFQSKLVSGTNIKSINNNSLLGSGNFNITVDLEDLSLPTANASTTNRIYLKNSTKIANTKEAWVTDSHINIIYDLENVFLEDDNSVYEEDSAIHLAVVNGVPGYYIVEYGEYIGEFIPVLIGDIINDIINNVHYEAVAPNGSFGWSGELSGNVTDTTITYTWKQIGKQIQSDWNLNNSSANDYIKNKPTIPTVPSNETAVSGGSTLSVVTTGEKYTWNNKANIWRGTQAQYDLLTPDNNTIYIITATP